MFSRICQSARSLVYNPQTKSEKFSPLPKQVMVTAKTKHAPLADPEALTDENTINVFVPTPSSKRRKRAEVEESDSESLKVVTPSPKKRKVLPVRPKGEEELLSKSRPVVEVPSKKMTPEAEEPSANLAQQSAAKKVHRRFDSEDHSEDHSEDFFSTAREQAVVVEDDDEDSDDDAPEAVGMHEAAQTVKSREQDAAKAVKEQKEASRQKRKDRDEALRKQSEAARKRKPRAKTDKVVTTIESDVEEEDIGGSEEEDEAPSKVLSKSRGLPELLPLELLEDDNESNEVIPAQEPTKIRSTKVKFRDLSEKAPKDKRVGGTTYRVTKIQNISMAPKASNNARSVKDAWINGRAGTSKDRIVRKPVSKGFFKK